MSRRIVGARLVAADTAWDHLCVVRETVETYGCPLAYYTDNHAIFTKAREEQTQYGRALKSMDIALKLTAKAHPEAKGKIEKKFDYFQRGVPLLCEKYRVRGLAQGQRVLDESVAFYNDCLWLISWSREGGPAVRWTARIGPRYERAHTVFAGMGGTGATDEGETAGSAAVASGDCDDAGRCLAMGSDHRVAATGQSIAGVVGSVEGS